MKNFDISKLLKDPSKIELDPTSPLTWALAAGAFLALVLLATILFFLIRAIRWRIEARGQRRAAERAAERNRTRVSEPVPASISKAVASDPDEPKPFPLELDGEDPTAESTVDPEAELARS